jgi:hypothetical protein
LIGVAKISGDVAVVAPSQAAARSAAQSLARRLPLARLHPLSERAFLASDPLLPVILAPGTSDAAAAARFFRRARERFLWSAPASDLYAAIEGVITRLPPRSRKPSSDTEAGDLSTALLLEGDVNAGRARAALASSVRRWIVEHPGRVRLSGRELGRLRALGVTWSALEPVRLLGIALCAGSGSSRRAAFSRVPVWRVPVTSRARARKPARK